MKPVSIDPQIKDLKPIDVKCSDTKCDQGFHYYSSEKALKNGRDGKCKVCKDDSIDWDRINRHDPNDLQYTFDSLKKELLRNVCWINDLDDEAIPFAIKRGRKVIISKAKMLLKKRIGHPIRIYYDKLCTPKKGKEIIDYAQHGTGTCCRICLDRWHNIPQHGDLTDEQIDYCLKLVELFINDKVPDLQDEPKEDTMKKAS